MADNNSTMTKVDQFKGVLNTQTIRAQLRNSLKEKAGSFMSSMIDLYSGDKDLQKCDPEKVALECVKAAAINLPLVKSMGLAYVVPYKGVPTFTIGYKGYIQLAQRTGQYRTINADNVYAGELRGFDKLSGMLDLSGERESDEIIGYFAYFKLLNGFEKTLYMSREDVEKWAKKYSPSYNSSYSPWKTEFDKMAQKTVLRRLIGTYGVMSIEMRTAMDQDDQGETPAARQERLASKTMIDVQGADVNPDTGEVTEAAPEPEVLPLPEQEPFDPGY